MGRTQLWLAPVAMGLFGCDVQIPEGKLSCSKDTDCPAAWVCADALCYRDAPGGKGGGSVNGRDGSQSGGDGGGTIMHDGGVDAASSSDAGHDATIDTTSCDAPMTFYRDHDGDGLGDATDSIMACSVDRDFVLNADDCDDACKLCTTAAAEEVCDGADNDCDGTVDEGALILSAPISYAGLNAAQWTELVATTDGGIVLSLVGAALIGQRVDTAGNPVGNAVTVADAAPTAPVLAADHLDGKVVVAYFEGSNIRAQVLNATDLSVAVTEKTIGTASTSFTLDVAVTQNAFGGRVLVLFDKSGVITSQAFRLTTLAIDGSTQTVYTPTGSSKFDLAGTLTAAPCLSGFYAAVLELDAKRLEVVPLTDLGKPTGKSFVAPHPGSSYIHALPALRVEGGDCDATPTRLVLAYATAVNFYSYGDSKLEVVYLDITRSGSFDDTLTKTSGVSITPEGWVLPSARAYPSGAVYANRALDIEAFDGRYVLGAMSLGKETAVGNTVAIELSRDSVVGTARGPSPPAPATPQSVQLRRLGSRLYLATGAWTHDAPAGLMRVGCGP